MQGEFLFHMEVLIMKRQISKYVLILLIIVCLIMLGFLIYLKFFSSTVSLLLSPPHLFHLLQGRNT